MQLTVTGKIRCLRKLFLRLLAMFCAGSSVAADVETATNNLIVYGPVPGLPPSEHYAVRVRPAGTAQTWQTTFVFKTACKDFGRVTGRSEPEKV